MGSPFLMMSDRGMLRFAPRSGTRRSVDPEKRGGHFRRGVKAPDVCHVIQRFANMRPLARKTPDRGMASIAHGYGRAAPNDRSFGKASEWPCVCDSSSGVWSCNGLSTMGNVWRLGRTDQIATDRQITARQHCRPKGSATSLRMSLLRRHPCAGTSVRARLFYPLWGIRHLSMTKPISMQPTLL